MAEILGGFPKTGKNHHKFDLPIAIPRSVFRVALPSDGRERGVRVGVAGSGTIAQFGHRVVRCRGLRLAVFPGIIVVGVTTGAIGPVGR